MKLVRNEENVGKSQHELVNLDHMEKDTDYREKNEINRRFFYVIRLQIAVDFNNEEPQQLRRCPETRSHAV
jgi:hypothetical protein